MKTYLSRTWLNKKNSSFAGNTTAYHGKHQSRKGLIDTHFRISDCATSIYMHPEVKDKKNKAYIVKLRKLAREATRFANWLENNS